MGTNIMVKNELSAGVLIKNNVYTISCTCGYVGFSRVKCNKCKKKIQVIVKDEPVVLHKLISKTITDEKISYIFERKVYYETYKRMVTEVENTYELLFDVSSGVTTFESKDNDYSVDFVDFSEGYRSQDYNRLSILHPEYLGSMWAMERRKKLSITKEITDILMGVTFLPEFFQHAFDKRGIIYKNPAEYITSPQGVQTAFLLLRYPALQNFPTFSFHSIPDKGSYRELLGNINSENDIWNLFTGHKSKTVKSLVQSEQDLNLLSIWGPFLKQTENLSYLLQTKTFEKKEQLVFDYVSQFERNEFVSGINFIKSLHDSETVWFRKIRKLIAKKKQKEMELIQFITDIGRMIETILLKEPEYQPIRFENILQLHDELSLKIKTVGKKNITFSYSDTEKVLNAQISNYSFLLAHDTYSLIEAGTKLKICVGSYDQKVLDKKCVIVFVIKDEKIEACLEIYNHNVIQAKTFCNHSPNFELRDVILKYVEQKKLQINTYDL